MYGDIDDDYYKPIKTYEAFDNSYVEYQSEINKNKILSIKEYLYTIRQYLSDKINDYKGERKIQLSMKINFVPFVDSGVSRDSKNFEDSEEFEDSEDSNKSRIQIFVYK